MDTTFPEGDSAKLTLTLAAPKTFTVAMRRPRWAGDGFRAIVDGQPVTDVPAPGSYVEISRAWKTGDTIELTLPKALHLEPIANDPHRVAIMWGPLMLAGDLGPEPARAAGRGNAPRESAAVAIPTIVTDSRNPADWLKPVNGKPGTFRPDGVTQWDTKSATRGSEPPEIDLIPFYREHRRVYMGYFDIYTPAEWTKRAAEVTAERERQHQLEAATVAFLQPGEMQPERDFNQQGENTTVARVGQRTGRTGRGWFSFDLPIDSSRANVIIVTYHADSRRARTFDILADGQRLASERFDISSENRFFDREYAVPASIVQGKQKLTVRFQATGGNDIATIFGIRVVRR
jgi:hypothetical protein